MARLTLTMPKELWVFRAQVLKMTDGDTFHVYMDKGHDEYHKHAVRLLDVNAPEMKSLTLVAGRAAREYVRLWLALNAGGAEWPLLVKTHKTEAFGRYLAQVWRVTDGAHLNTDLVAAGFAVPFMVGTDS